MSREHADWIRDVIFTSLYRCDIKYKSSKRCPNYPRAFSIYLPQSTRVLPWPLNTKPCQKKRLVRFPHSHSKTQRKRWQRCICSDQILTFIKITTHVQISGGSTLCQWAQATYKPNIGLIGKPRASLRAHILSDITYPEPHDSSGPQQLVQGSSYTDTKDPPRATQVSYMKTLWSSLLLCYLQLTRSPCSRIWQHYLIILM